MNLSLRHSGVTLCAIRTGDWRAPSRLNGSCGLTSLDGCTQMRRSVASRYGGPARLRDRRACPLCVSCDAFDDVQRSAGGHDLGELVAGIVQEHAVFGFCALAAADHQHLEVEELAEARRVAWGSASWTISTRPRSCVAAARQLRRIGELRSSSQSWTMFFKMCASAAGTARRSRRRWSRSDRRRRTRRAALARRGARTGARAGRRTGVDWP